MKRLFVILVFLFLFPVLSAVEIDMKTDFSQGETLMAKVSGNFFEAISEEDIFFFRGHVKTSIVPSVTKIDDDFYIYAQLFGKAPNNYSIVIEDAKYFQFNKIIEKDLVKNFSINENFADFSVDKGFVVTDESFSLNVKNLIDGKITINIGVNDSSLVGISPKKNSATLKVGETIKIDFEVENNKGSSLNIIKLSTENLEYQIPVYLFSTLEKEDKEKKRLTFEQSVIELTIATDSEAEGIIYLKNTGDAVLENISLILSDSLIPYVSLSLYEIDEIEGNSSKKIYVSFFSDDEEREIEGQITAISEEFFAYTSVFLNFLPDYIPLDGEENEIRTFQSCDELGGIICTENQECFGESGYATDGICCLGSCNETQKSSTGKIIGWAIIFVIIIVLIMFYLKKYKGAGRVVDLLKIGRRR